MEDVKKGLKIIKNGKTARQGRVRIELHKHKIDKLIELLAKIFNRCLLNGGNIPLCWRMTYINSILKKG